MDIGFIGLGIMGKPMVRNLIKDEMILKGKWKAVTQITLILNYCRHLRSNWTELTVLIQMMMTLSWG